MKLRHFETLQPICPTCRDDKIDQQFSLKLTTTLKQENDHVLEGILNCSNPDCLREYPIIDGIPIIVSRIRSYISENLSSIDARDDLEAVTESIVGDCCGPNSSFETIRQQLSSYAWDHYAEFDPEESFSRYRPSSAVGILEEALARAGEIAAGPIIEVGSSVGRTSFELAQRYGELVLGIDLNFSMLRLASRALRCGIVRYPRRRVGVVYDRREFPVSFVNDENVDFWACDAAALPFQDNTFSLAVSLNTLDCFYSPVDSLSSISRVLKSGGCALITCPYDWSSSATPVESWLGGHSQRGSNRGVSAEVLRALLMPGAQPQTIKGLELRSEIDGLEWNVRMHERCTVAYNVHAVIAEAVQ